MGYSVKEVVNNINHKWFLPAIQRPYVWGSRHEEEKYICRLFDSILRGYPIGLLILWKPEKLVPFREFVGDYEEDYSFKPKDEQDFPKESSLVYDGQQRLQTLYSCLKYSIKGRKLVFDLSYKPNKEEEGHDTGFHFIDDDGKQDDFEIRMTRVFNMQTESDNFKIRKEYKQKAKDEDTQDLIECNLDKLFKVFASIKEESPSMSVFEIKGATDDEVNEIFQRLNMGGVQLSNADLLFSRIKEVSPRFESDIIDFSKDLSKDDCPTLSAYDVLQLIHIIVMGRTRIEPESIKCIDDIQNFISCWERLKVPFKDTMVRYLKKNLNINRIQIIPRKMPLLALIVYMYHLYNGGDNIIEQERQPGWQKRIDKFFIISELNDWSLQSYVDNFAKIFKENPNKKDFPLEKILEWVENKGNRFVEVSEKAFCDNRWFSLKVVLPKEHYTFKEDMTKRFNPELDHIFPVRLKGMDKEYRDAVDVVWNMQPITGDINIDKSNFHPLKYFKGEVPGHEYGKKYFDKYKVVPALDNPVWNDYKQFVQYRKGEFIKLMEELYDIKIQ